MSAASILNIHLKLLVTSSNLNLRIKMTDAQEWRQIFVLLKLAEMGANKRTAKISTEYLAEKIGTSQQTASRYLIELEKKHGLTAR